MLVDAVPRRGALGEESQEALRDVRGLDPPFEVLSRGQTAALVDLKESLANHLPAALAVLMGTTVIARPWRC